MFCAVFSGTVIVNAGCVLSALLQLCSYHYHNLSSTNVGGGQAAYRLTGNVTSDATQSSVCFRQTTLFASVTSARSKAAVDFTRIKNITAGTTLFHLGHYILLLPTKHCPYTLRLFAGAGEEPIAERNAWVLPEDFLRISNPTEKSQRACCSSVLEITGQGQWTKQTTGQDEWHWSPSLCDYCPRNAAALTQLVSERGLKDLTLIGSSRARTLFYDLITLLAPDDKFVAEKAHHPLLHHISNGRLDLKLHYLILDCVLDVPKGTKMLNTYNRVKDNISHFLRNNSLCQYGAGETGKAQAVIFSTGICEADRVKQSYFERHIPSLLSFIHNQCAPRGANSSLVFKTEESVDPSLRYFNDLNTNTHYIAQTLQNSLDPLQNYSSTVRAFVDTTSLSRSFKIFNDSLDGVHYYSVHTPFIGDKASTTIASLVLQAALEEGRSLANNSNENLDYLPHTILQRVHPLDGTLVASDRNKKSIYQISNGAKRAVPDWDTFLSLGSDWSDIELMADAEFQALPTGLPLPSVGFRRRLTTQSHNGSKSEKTCRNASWPSLELLVPVVFIQNDKDPRRWEFETQFLRTLLFFFPLRESNVSVTLLYDEALHGSRGYNEFLSTIRGVESRVPGGIRMLPLSSTWAGQPGNIRQQMAMFWAENFTSRPYVGFIDTDAAFLTYVDVEDLFEDADHKPVINGRSGYHKEVDGWEKVPQHTYHMTGLLEPLRCMSYFPVILKTSHLREIRDFLLRKQASESTSASALASASAYETTTSFNALMEEYHRNGTQFAQFNVFCSVLFAMKREEYKWYAHSETPTWDGVTPPPHPGQSGNVSAFTPQMLLPKPRIATHVRYRTTHKSAALFPNFALPKQRGQFNLMMQAGYCISPPLPKSEPVCLNQSSTHDGYHREMHYFEYFDWADVQPKEALQREFAQRQQRIANCTHDWDAAELSVVLRPGEQQGSGW